MTVPVTTRVINALYEENSASAMALGWLVAMAWAAALVLGLVAFVDISESLTTEQAGVFAGLFVIGLTVEVIILGGLLTGRRVQRAVLVGQFLAIIPVLVAVLNGGAYWILVGLFVAAVPSMLPAPRTNP